MTNSTDVYWEVDGVSLQTLAWNIVTWGGDREAPPPVRGSNITVPYVPGQTWTRKTPDSRVITLAMWVVGANEDGSIPTSGSQRALFEKNWHQLRNLLFKPRRQLVLKKRFRIFGDNTVYTGQALAEYAGGLNPTMNGEFRAAFTVDLLLADPYFYGDPITLSIDPDTPEEEFTILGDDRTMDIEFDITGLSKRLRVANETYGVSFDYTNPLPAGQVAHIDVKDFEARHNTAGANTPAATFIDHSGDPFWFFLEPGKNKLGIAEMDVPTRGTVWTNLATNPSFETPGTSSTLRTNLMVNPELDMSDTTTLAIWRTNYIVNPSFETNASNWGTQNAGVTAVRDTTTAFSGTGSLKVTTAGASNDGVFSTPPALSDWVGKPVVASFMAKIPTGKVLVASLMASAGATIPGTTVNVTGTGDWQRVDLPYGLVPAGSSAGPYIYIRSLVATPAFSFWVDQVNLERANYIGDLFNGATPNANGKTYAWTGTAHASTSTASAMLQTLVVNQATNPGFEASAAGGVTNQMPNSSMESAAGYVNLIKNPRAVDATDRANWPVLTDGSGGTFFGTYSATGGPTAGAPSYVTNTTSGTPNTGYMSFGPSLTPVSPGNWYTGFFYGKTNFAGTQCITVTWYDAAGNYISGQDVTSAQAIASGVWQSVRGTFQAPSGAQSVSIRAKFSGFTSTSQQASATAFMLIPVVGAAFEYPFDYFDGSSSPLAEYVANWSGTAHQSTTVLREAGSTTLTNLFLHGAANASKGTKSVIRTNLIRNPRFGSNTTDWSVGAGSGTATLTRQTTGGPTDYYFDGASTFARAAWTAQSTTFGEVIMNAGTGVPVTPGLQYAFSIYAKTGGTASSAAPALYIDWYNSSNALLSTASGPTPSILSLGTTWNRWGFVGTAPANAAYAVLRLRLTGTIPSGFQLDVGCAMLEATTFYANNGDWPYFDGATTMYGTNNGQPTTRLTNVSDYFTSWTGTAQNSSSTLSAYDIWGLNPNNAVAVYGHADKLYIHGGIPAGDVSYQWKNGQALVYSTNQNDSGYVSVMYDDAIAGGLFTPGQTYTVLLRYAIYGLAGYQIAAPTGTQEALVYTDNVNAAVQTRSTYYTQTNGALGGNTGRIQELRLTFTVAPTATSASVRFYLGRSQGIRYYALDDILIVPGTYTGNYFDGDSADTATHTHVWNGAAYASTSTRISKGTNGYQNVVLDPSFENWDYNGFQGALQRTEVYRNRFFNPQFNTKSLTNDISILRSNSATNPRVQTNANLYSVVAGTGGTAAVTRVTTAPLPGPASIAAYARATWSVANTAAGTGYVQYGVSGTQGVFPGDYYQLSAYVRDSLSQVKTIQAVWLDSGGAVLSTSTGTSSPADTNWSRLSVTAVVPASAASVVIRIVAAGVRSVNSTLDVTGVFIEYVENGLVPLQPYFDGATAASGPYTYAWSGGAADSTATSYQAAPRIQSNFPMAQSGSQAYQSQDGGQNRLRILAQKRNEGQSYQAFDLTSLFAGHYEIRVDCAYISTALVGVDHANRGTMQLIYKDASNVTQTAVSNKAAISTSFTTLSISVDVPSGGTSGTFELRLYHGGITGDPDLIWDNLSIVAAKPVAGAPIQFSGASPAVGDMAFAWDGTVDNSASIASYPGLGWYSPLLYTLSQGRVMGTTEWKSQGNNSLRMYVDNPRFTGANMSRWALPYIRPGQTYFVRAKLNIPQLLTGTTSNTGKFGYTTSDSTLGPTFFSTGFVNAVGTQTIQTIFTADQDIISNALLFDWSMDAGQVMYMDELEVVHVPAGTTLADMAALPQVTGYAQPANGYETAWSGAASLSPSWLFAPMPYKAETPSNAHAILSNAWGNPGTKSLRIRPVFGSSNASYVDLDNGTGGLRLGLTPGQTYTIQARFRMSGAQTGTLNTNARLFQLVRTVGGSQVVSASNQATNTAGEQVLTLTVALEAGATDAFLRLWNGASYGGGDVYFDQILVVNIGTSTNQFPLGYFDGSMVSADPDITYQWTGSAGVSTSQAAWNTFSAGSSQGIYTIQSKQWAGSGIASLRLVPISTTSNDSWHAPLGTSGLTGGMIPGLTYTVRATRRLVAPQTGSRHANAGQLIVTYRVSGVSTTLTTSLPNTAGSQDASITFTLPVGADLAYVRLYNGALLNGGDVWWDNFLIVQVPDTSSPYTGSYFDGDTPGTTDTINNWSGAQYTSTSLRQGVKLNKISGSNAVQSNSVANKGMVLYPYAGQESYADITATIAGGMLNNQSYLLRGKITLTATQQGTPNSHARKIVVVWSTGELVPVYEQTVPNIVGTYEYVAIVNTPATGTLTAVRVYNGDLYVGSPVTWDQFLVGQNLNQSAVFFSGDTPSAGGDFQYAWTGASDDSTSVMSGTSVASVTAGPNASPIYAASWSSYGGHSMLVYPLTSSPLSYVSPGGDSGALRLGMIAGGSYTAQVKVHLDTPQVSPDATNARTIQLWWKDTVDGQYHAVASNQAPNASGTYFLRVTATIPATASEAFVRIYSGSSLGDSSVYFDEFLLVQVDSALDPYLGDYFDGSTPDTDYADYGWTGTPDASTSTIKGVAATAPVELTYRPAWL